MFVAKGVWEMAVEVCGGPWRALLAVALLALGLTFVAYILIADPGPPGPIF